MPRAPTIEQQIAAIRSLDLTIPTSLSALRETLSTRLGMVVAVAVRRIAEHPLPELTQDLVDAFGRMCDDGAKRDPQCVGKVAIIRALHTLDSWDVRVFKRGLTYQQYEGMLPQDDMAAELRGLCGLVHAQHGLRDALDVLAELLRDGERITRQIAARGLGDSGRPDACALLRYKILEGDPDAEVLAACFESMFALAREETVPFVLRFLDDHDERAQVAVLALAQGRVSEAFEPITTWLAKASPAQRHQIGYLALALLRFESATEWLLDVIRTKPKPEAEAAVRALANFAADPAMDRRVREAIAGSKDARGRRELVTALER